MSFENSYSTLLNAIVVSDYTKAENILSECDDRRTMLISAINDIGEQRVQSMIELFRGMGLKRALEKIMQSYSGFDMAKNINLDFESNKVVYVHQKNKLNNEKYHLSGSSFENEKKSRVSA